VAYEEDDPQPAAGTPRIVALTPRTAFMLWASLAAIGVGLWLVYLARHVLIWILIAVFLAVAVDPLVRSVQSRGVRRRGLAAALVYLAGLALVALGAALLLPTLISQINDFVHALPQYVNDLTHGRGPFGFLERKYHVVEHTRELVKGKGGGHLSGGATALLNITKSVATGVAALVTIGFLSLFMVLEGPAWVERAYALMTADGERRWRRVGDEIYHVIAGYVTGNLIISLVAGTATTIVLLLLGVPFALALGLLVAILDLIPLAGASIAAVVVTLVALSHSTSAAIIVFCFFVGYQQVENHLLQPLVYGRTVELSPLAALIAVVLGAQLAGVVGALFAIPVAGSIRAVLRDWLARRLARREPEVLRPAGDRASPPAAPV